MEISIAFNSDGVMMWAQVQGKLLTTNSNGAIKIGNRLIITAIGISN